MGYNSKELKVKSTARKLAKPKDAIVSQKGQYEYPGEITKILGNQSGTPITMKGVSNYLKGVDNLGNQQIMYPGAEYFFPGSSVTEYPIKRQEGLKQKTGGSIPIGLIYPSQDLSKKKRKVINSLKAAIAKGEYIEPIEVKKAKKGYEVVDGHHRLMAYLEMGVKDVPVKQNGGLALMPNEDTTTNPFTDGIENVRAANKKARDFNTKYVQSKHYENLLKKQGYTAEEIQARKNAVLNLGDDKVKYTTSGDSFVYGDDNDVERIDYNITNPGDWPGWNSIAAHEWGHVGVNSGAMPLKEGEKRLLRKQIKENLSDQGQEHVEHDLEPQENRADLTQMRQALSETGIYDSTSGKRFKKKYLKQLQRKADQDPELWNRMFRLYKEPQIKKLMNNVASIDTQDSDVQYAQDGVQKESGTYVKVNTPEGVKTLNTDSEEYRRYYGQGTDNMLAVNYDGTFQGKDLPEATVTSTATDAVLTPEQLAYVLETSPSVDRKSFRPAYGEDIDPGVGYGTPYANRIGSQRYPNWDGLTEEEKRLISDSGPIGRSIRSKAGFGKDYYKENDKYGVSDLGRFIYETSPLSAIQRRVSDPRGTLRGIFQTGADILGSGIAVGDYYLGSGQGFSGVNPLTGENYGGGLDEVLDIADILPVGKVLKTIKKVKEAKNLLKNTAIADNTIREEGKKFVNRLMSPEGKKRLKNQFAKADPTLNDKQLDWLVQTRINEVNTATEYNDARALASMSIGDPEILNNEAIVERFMPKENAHFSTDQVFGIEKVKAPPDLFPIEMIVTDFDNVGVSSLARKDIKEYGDFLDPNFEPGSIALGRGLETNKGVARHEVAHAIQKGKMPIDYDLLEMMKSKNLADRVWRAALTLTPQLKYGDLSYFEKAGGRSIKNEAYPFQEELRSRLLNRGIIKDDYETITAKTLAKARLDALIQLSSIGKNFKEGTRLLKFTPPWKYKELARLMNEAPALIPTTIGTGALTVGALQEKRYGGGFSYQPGGVVYGSPEYNKAYREGTIARQVGDEYIMNLPDAEALAEQYAVTAKDPMKEKYPYWDYLSAEQKKYINEPGSIGRGVRAQATSGYGINGNPTFAKSASDFAMGSLTAGPVGFGKVLQTPQSLAVEGVEALRGNPYNFSDAVNIDPYSITQRSPSDTFLKDAPGWLQLAGDIVLDPSNLVGAGLAGKSLKGTKALEILKQAPGKSIDFINQAAGKVLKGRANKAAIKEGNDWLKAWIDHPVTQAKINKDLVKKTRNRLKDEPFSIEDYNIELGREQAKNFIPGSAEYPLKTQLKEFFDPNVKPIHLDNFGVSYLHNKNPVRRDYSDTYKKNPKYYGSWISRDPFVSSKKRTSTTIHEGTHDWGSDYLLEKSGQKDFIYGQLDPEHVQLTKKWDDLRNQGIDPSKHMTPKEEDIAYLADPTEVHARIMELRKHFKLKPDIEVDPDMAQAIINNIDEAPVDKGFKKIINDDPIRLANLMNKLWMAPAALVGTAALTAGTSALQEKKYGGGFKDLNFNEEDYMKKGGSKKLKINSKFTNKNIQSSINELFKRNEMLFGSKGKKYYKPFEEGGSTNNTNMKKLTDKEIAFPQQPTAAEFYARGFVPNAPVGFYRQGGMSPAEAYPQQPPADIFFSGYPFQPQYMRGGMTNGIAFPQQPTAEYFFSGFPWESKYETGGPTSSAPQDMNSIDAQIANKKNNLLKFLQSNSMKAIAREESQKLKQEMIPQMGANYFNEGGYFDQAKPEYMKNPYIQKKMNAYQTMADDSMAGLKSSIPQLGLDIAESLGNVFDKSQEEEVASNKYMGTGPNVSTETPYEGTEVNVNPSSGNFDWNSPGGFGVNKYGGYNTYAPGGEWTWADDWEQKDKIAKLKSAIREKQGAQWQALPADMSYEDLVALAAKEGIIKMNDNYQGTQSGNLYPVGMRGRGYNGYGGYRYNIRGRSSAPIFSNMNQGTGTENPIVNNLTPEQEAELKKKYADMGYTYKHIKRDGLLRPLLGIPGPRVEKLIIKKNRGIGDNLFSKLRNRKNKNTNNDSPDMSSESVDVGPPYRVDPYAESDPRKIYFQNKINEDLERMDNNPYFPEARPEPATPYAEQLSEDYMLTPDELKKYGGGLRRFFPGGVNRADKMVVTQRGPGIFNPYATESIMQGVTSVLNNAQQRKASQAMLAGLQGADATFVKDQQANKGLFTINEGYANPQDMGAKTIGVQSFMDANIDPGQIKRYGGQGGDDEYLYLNDDQINNFLAMGGTLEIFE